MSELNNYKLNDEALDQVTGGNDGRSEYFSVRDISPRWVKVTSSSLNCRYSPNGEIAKVYEKGHKLKERESDSRIDRKRCVDESGYN